MTLTPDTKTTAADTAPLTPADLDDQYTQPEAELPEGRTWGDLVAEAKARTKEGVQDPDAFYTDKGTLQHKVVPALHDHLVDVRKINNHPDNPNEGDIPAIAVSLDHFGQVRPILVQKSTSYIVAGNHTYKAARLLGWRYVAAVVHDMTNEEALKYLVADNRLAERAKRNPTKMADLLAGALFDPDTVGGPDALLVMGYTPDEAEEAYGEQLAMIAPTNAGEEMPAQYAPNTEQEGRRDKRTTAPLREVVMMMTKDDAQALGVKLDALKAKLGTKELTDTVLALVEFAYRALCQDDAVAPADAERSAELEARVDAARDTGPTSDDEEL